MTVLWKLLAVLATSSVPGFAQELAPQTGSACTLRATGGDDGPRFLAATRRCSKITIPKSTTLNISTALNMTNLHNTHINLQGTIKFNPDIPYWAGHAFYFKYQDQVTFWLLGGKNVRLDGGGTLDGSGQAWYDARPGNSSLLRPVILTVYQANRAVVENIKMINSPEWFNLIYESKNVRFSKISINSETTSENGDNNTDGWDIFRSDSVVIEDSIINSGDDCVSFKPNSTNILISNLNCNGSHGISVGSLGQYPGQYDIVENVTVRDIVMSNASNGARIKAWAGPNVGSGIVRNILYQGFASTNIDFPIIIDQCYFTNATACAAFPSNTYIENVWFNNVTGTSSGPTVASLKCSPDGRCNNINVNDLDLVAGSGTAAYICNNVKLTGNSASLFPAACQ